ncbi:hypothetical protein L209DRAFT_584534 [Thermothelomyces heterothallicus CBS 203.75]
MPQALRVKEKPPSYRRIPVPRALPRWRRSDPYNRGPRPGGPAPRGWSRISQPARRRGAQAGVAVTPATAAAAVNPTKWAGIPAVAGVATSFLSSLSSARRVSLDVSSQLSARLILTLNLALSQRPCVG